MKNIYEIYEKLLRDKGLTNYKVSKGTGISQSLLSKWKVTGNTPKIDTLRRIAAYLDVSMDYLTGNVYGNEPAILYVTESEADYGSGSDDMDKLMDYARNMNEETLKRLLSYAEFLKKEGAE